jgi:hypothetical protein
MLLIIYILYNVMKLSIKEEVNLSELYYLFADLKKSTDGIIERYYLDQIYNILKYNAENIDINSIYDAVLKNYIIINVSNDIKENINEYYFYNYVYIYDNKLTKKIGNIKYKNFMFNPLLNHYNRYIKEASLSRNYNNVFKIHINDITESLDLSYNNIFDNSKIINYINDINKIELLDFNKYNTNQSLDKMMIFIKNNFGYNTKDKYNTNITNRYNNIHYIINNTRISLRDSNYLYIINKYFNSADFNKFKKKYDINKNIKKSLSDKDYDTIEILFNKEQTHLKLIENNTCEHIQIIDNGEIDTIIKLYIKDNYNQDKLHMYGERFICKKCKLPLICPHNVYKSIFPKKNLNEFININDSLNESVFCKICGEFLWSNNINRRNPQDRVNDYTYRDLFDLDHNENIDQMIHRIIYNYFLSNNVLHKKKNIRNDSILSFVKNHIYSDIEDQFFEINKSITTDNLTKITNKSLIIYIYVFCSIIYLTIHNNKILTLFDLKVSHIDKIIQNVINDVKAANKYAIKKYNDSQIKRLVYAIHDKLSKNTPHGILLHEIDINYIKKESILKFSIYNYIFLINNIYFEKNFDKEYVLNTLMNDINVNFNNVYIPTLSFLNKKGGRDIEPYLKNEKQFTNKIKNIFIEFANSNFVFSYLHNNPNYKLLQENLKNIKYSNVKHNKAYNTNILKEKLNTKDNIRYQINSKLFKYNKLNNYVIEKKQKTIIYVEYNKITQEIYEKQLFDINKLLNTELKIINIFDIISIISFEFSYYTLDIINNDEFIISQRIKLLSNSKLNENTIVNGDLYKTLLNIKNNITLNKYYESIIKYIKEYDNIHNMQKIKISETIIALQISSDENFEQPNICVDEDASVEHDFGNENFDYDAEYSDEDVNLKEPS